MNLVLKWGTRGDEMDNDNIKVKSLYKSLQILECFTVDTPELGITEIADMLGIYKSNVHNILTTLEYAGYIYKNPLTQKYGLANKILEFSYVVTSQLSYQNVVYQVMKRVSETLNTIAYFGVPHGHYVLYMFSTYPKVYDNNYPVRSIMGEKAPMYCTSIGKAMLSMMSREEILERINMDKIKYTDNTLIDEKEILEDVLLSAKRGYAIDNIEHEPDVRCIGVPVIDRSHKLIGSLSVSGPAHNFSDEKIENFSKFLIDAAFEIRRRL